MKRHLGLVLLTLTSSIIAMDLFEELAAREAQEAAAPVLSDDEMREAKTAIMAFTRAITNRNGQNNLPELPDPACIKALEHYLTDEQYIDSRKQYNGRVRLYVALELLEHPMYSGYKSKILKAISNCESLHLLPHVKLLDIKVLDSACKFIKIRRGGLTKFTKKKRVSDETLQSIELIQKTLKEKYTIMARLLNASFHRSKTINDLRDMVNEASSEDWLPFMLMQGEHDAITGDTRLFHACCKTILRNMGYLAESYRDEQQNDHTRRTLTQYDYNEVTPIVEDLLKSWAEKSNIDINTKDLNYEDTPLHHVCRFEHDDVKMNVVIKALLEAKADPSIKNINGQTPLDLCEKKASRKTLEDWLAANQPAQNQQQQVNPTTATTTTSN